MNGVLQNGLYSAKLSSMYDYEFA